MMPSRDRRVFKLWKESKGCQLVVVMNEAGLFICSEHVLQDSSTRKVKYKPHYSKHVRQQRLKLCRALQKPFSPPPSHPWDSEVKTFR